MGEDALPPAASGGIPYRLLVGVTGHRQLPDDPALAETVRRVLVRAKGLLPESPATPVLLTAVSPLAEGADRLVAQTILQTTRGTLDVRLPLPPEDYRQDFSSRGSQDEFGALLARASEIAVLPPAPTRQQAYEQVGIFVVDHCDVLLALWDGLAANGRGGTGEIVARGRERGCPLFWIRPSPPYDIQEEAGVGVNRRAFQALDTFNRARVNSARLTRATQRHTAAMLAAAGQAGLSVDLVRTHCASFLPSLLRADTLARRAQQRFSWFAVAQYLLAAAAIGAGALQTTLATGSPAFAWAEVGLLGAMLVIWAVGKRAGKVERWIASRVLAERLRSRLFLAIAGADENPERAGLRHPPDEWIERAVAAVWRQRPSVGCAEPDLPALKRFLAAAWFADQRRYYKKTRRRHARRRRQLATVTVVAFGVTLAAALLRSLGVLGAASQGDPKSRSGVLLLVALTIILPTLAGTLRGIGAQQENVRNAERSGRVVPYLETVAQRLARAPDLAAAQADLRDAEEIIRSENHDWITVMRLHELGLDT